MAIPIINRCDIGQRFGRWTVTGTPVRRGKDRYVECRCDCGCVRVLQTYRLCRGLALSCGCANRKEVNGSTHPAEYTAWVAMRQRCKNAGNPLYRHYGARGITVAPEWEEFACFLKDMGPKPSAAHSIHRVDNDGGYCKANCRWALRVEQANNTSRNHRLAYGGKTLTLQQWADALGIRYTTLSGRLGRGWTAEEALTVPAECNWKYLTAFGETKTQRQWLRDPRCVVTKSSLVRRLRKGLSPEEALTRPAAPGTGPKPRPARRILEFRGERMSLKDWAKRLGINYRTIHSRLKRGWPLEEVLTLPAQVVTSDPVTGCWQRHSQS